MSASVRHLPPRPDTVAHFDTGTSLSADNQGCLVASMHLEGELCAASAPRLAGEIAALLELGVVDLYIDLDDLELCTSDGLALWEEAHLHLDEVGGGLHLSGGGGVVQRVIDVVRSADPSFAPVAPSP